ncbi:MAG: AEC family transporter [Pseudomonadota bacterium]|nr:AEC family transporter [Pseudomonadota bacterium]
MTNPLPLLPDFLLILVGWLVCRHTALNRPIWEAAERLVYYLLFPVLLFNSIVKSPLQPAETLNLAAASVGTVVCGIVLAYALKRWPGVDARLHASGAQTVFRFNTFIALALSERIGGAQGLAWMALVVGLCIPIVNIAAVWPLARHGGHSYARELLRNPLILSTLAGLLANIGGLHFPDAVATTLQRIGLAALPLGLMAVGAGLQLGRLKASPTLVAALLGLRHVVLPAIAWALTTALALGPEQRAIVVLFAALPTASSAYVLAARMGGDGAFVAGLVTLSTLLGMISIPFWLAVQAGLHF